MSGQEQVLRAGSPQTCDRQISAASIGCVRCMPAHAPRIMLHSMPSALPIFPCCRKQHPGANLLMGGAAGTIAATVCYPLDTIRRRMQMKGTMYSGQVGVSKGGAVVPCRAHQCRAVQTMRC